MGEVVKEVTRNDSASEAPIMMITANHGFIEQSERYAFNNAGESLKRYILLEKGELAYNHGASKLRPYGSCFALTTAENARIPFVYHCFSAEEQNAEFISIELNGSDVENQLRKIVSSGARMDGLLNISFAEYTSVSVLLPKIEEQNRIADFFRNLDHLISLHQRKLEMLKKVKKSMLEKMFPKNDAKVPEVRFSGFTDAWEQRRVGEFLSISKVPGHTGLNAKKLTVKLWGKGIIEKTDKLSGSENTRYYVRYAGQFMYGKLDFLHAAFGIVPDDLDNYESTLDSPAFDLHNIDGKFLLERVTQKDFYLRNGMTANGSRKAKRVHEDVFLNMDLVVTSYQEQEIIGKFFNKFDHLISLHQRKYFSIVMLNTIIQIIEIICLCCFSLFYGVDYNCELPIT